MTKSLRIRGPIDGYFYRVWTIVTRPTAFFQQLPDEGGLAGPLAFAVVTQWIGTSIQYLWNSLIGGLIGKQFDDLFKMASDVAEIDSPGRGALVTQVRDQIGQWLVGVGSVVIDPFVSLFKILFVSFFVFVGARLLISPGRPGTPQAIRFDTIVRIVCFGLAPSILYCVPIVGWLLSGIFVWTVTVVGLRETYKITASRASMVALFPYLLFIAMMFVMLALAILMFVKLVAAMF